MAMIDVEDAADAISYMTRIRRTVTDLEHASGRVNDLAARLGIGVDGAPFVAACRRWVRAAERLRAVEAPPSCAVVHEAITRWTTLIEQAAAVAIEGAAPFDVALLRRAEILTAESEAAAREGIARLAELKAAITAATAAMPGARTLGAAPRRPKRRRR